MPRSRGPTEPAADLGRSPGRVLLAAQPGRAGLRGARAGAQRRLRPARRGRAAGSALRHGASCSAASGFLRTTVAVGPCVAGELACCLRRVRSGCVATPEHGRGRVRDRPRGRRHGLSLRARRAGGRRRCECRRRSRRRDRCSPRGSRRADERERHRGLSHHTLAVLELVSGSRTVAWPDGPRRSGRARCVEIVDASGWRAACEGLQLSHMGRGPGRGAVVLRGGLRRRASSRARS